MREIPRLGCTPTLALWIGGPQRPKCQKKFVASGGRRGRLRPAGPGGTARKMRPRESALRCPCARGASRQLKAASMSPRNRGRDRTETAATREKRTGRVMARPREIAISTPAARQASVQEANARNFGEDANARIFLARAPILPTHACVLLRCCWLVWFLAERQI